MSADLARLRLAAQNKYRNQNSDIEFDELTEADVSRADSGIWVRCWAWLDNEDICPLPNTLTPSEDLLFENKPEDFQSNKESYNFLNCKVLALTPKAWQLRVPAQQPEMVTATVWIPRSQVTETDCLAIGDVGTFKLRAWIAKQKFPGLFAAAASD